MANNDMPRPDINWLDHFNSLNYIFCVHESMCLVDKKEPHPLLALPLTDEEETDWMQLCWVIRRKRNIRAHLQPKKLRPEELAGLGEITLWFQNNGLGNFGQLDAHARLFQIRLVPNDGIRHLNSRIAFKSQNQRNASDGIVSPR